MAVFLQPIFTQTVGSGGASQIVFNNIPQVYTDLKIVISSRANTSASQVDGIGIQFNSDTASNYSLTQLFADGASVASSRNANLNFIYGGVVNAATGTANTFTNTEILIPNYSGANFKAILVDRVAENNSVTGVSFGLQATLWRSTSGITSMRIYDYNGTFSFVQHSTFSLYGILRQGV